MAQPVTVNISTGTIAKLVIVVLLLGFLYLVRDVIAVLFVSLVFAAAFDPWVDWLQRKGFPRALNILLIYLMIFGVFGLSITLLIPPITQQVGQLANNFPQLYERVLGEFENVKSFSTEHGLTQSLERGLQNLQANIGRATGGIISTVSGIFGGIVSFVAILVITFYVVIEENGIKRFLRSFTPSRYQPYLHQLVNRIQEHMGLWLRGQLLLLVIIGVLSYIALLAIGVEYPLALALWAGLTEFVPLIGPVIGGIPAVFIAFSQSPLQGFLTIGAYVLIQQLENHLIVPRVMSKTIGLNPVLVIIVMLVGAKVAGVIGIILAIPATLIVSAVVTSLVVKREEAETRLEV